MSDLEKFAFEADGAIHEATVSAKLVEEDDSLFDEERGFLRDEAIARLQQAQQLIRFYTTSAIKAFKDFDSAEIEEVTLKFGIKIGGKVGIPYITEGQADSNLEVQVKCTFPKPEKPTSPT